MPDTMKFPLALAKQQLIDNFRKLRLADIKAFPLLFHIHNPYLTKTEWWQYNTCYIKVTQENTCPK